MRPMRCPSCAEGLHRAYCLTYPVPCEDKIALYVDGARDLRTAVIQRLRGKSAMDGNAIVKLINDLETMP